MKISCTQENLNQGLFVVSHIASKNAALPILNNILLSAQKNTITLSATNLEIGVSCIIRGKIEEEGEFTVQSRLLADYISLLPKDKVDLSTDYEIKEGQDLILKVSCKKHTTKIKGQLAADFPLIPKIEKQNPFIINYHDFRQALSQTIFAVSNNETRPEISGVLFNFDNHKLIITATDSYRLAERTVNLDKKSKNGSQKVIVPARTLQELQRILGSFKDPAAISEIENIEIYLAENQILFVIDSIELISRLVEGQYPDYQQIIPQQTNTKAVLESNNFTKAIKTASLFARSGIYDVNLEFLPEKNEVVVSAGNSQLGENISELEGEVKGNKNNIVVNYRYVLDGLQNLDSDQVEINIIDGTNPCVLKPTNKDANYLYIVMPIRQ